MEVSPHNSRLKRQTGQPSPLQTELILTACHAVDKMAASRNPFKLHEQEKGMATPLTFQETFDKLLIRLNPDRERAGEEYELLRLKLLTYFRSRAYLRAEDLADETLNRLAKKIAE